jgi:hypothetical protein
MTRLSANCRGEGNYGSERQSNDIILHIKVKKITEAFMNLTQACLFIHAVFYF